MPNKYNRGHRRHSRRLATTQRSIDSRPVKSPNELYGKSLATVFKEYLPYVAECYAVQDYEEESSPSECVASFDIGKLVLESDDNVIDKLKNIYHLLANSDDGIALIIHRTFDDCRVSIAVATARKDSEAVVNLAGNVRDALMGNFPGTECTPVSHFSDEPSGAFSPLNQNTNFGNGAFNSIGIVSNIATEYADEFSTQGIERLIDGIRLQEDEEYTLVLLARSLPPQELMRKKDSLYRLYTALSPFAQVQRSWGQNESTTWTESVNVGVFGATPGLPAVPVPHLGINFGVGTAHGKTRGTSISDTVTITEYGVSHTLDTIKKQMHRIEECEALGLWQFAAYVISSDYRIVNEVSHMYMSLTQGNESFYERPSINIWNAQSDGGARRGEIEEMRKYLTHLEHPWFEIAERGSSNFNQRNWPEEVRCIAEISGSELTKALNLPSRSIPGLPVIECAAFGREVSSYDPLLQADVRLGKIHHMHHDEEKHVDLSAESLVSHVFVTGSTGAGKSNTVYHLLDEAACNFLVIEPAKGEYRSALGGEASCYGTNPVLGDLLRINPFVFPDGIHVYEHIERIIEVFNVCWPMYAAMPAVLKDAIIAAYEKVGWDLRLSRNTRGRFFPTFDDVCEQIDRVIESSDYSDENKGNYRGSLKTRLRSLTNGINGLIFCNGSLSDEELFDSKTIVDLSRVGSTENKALIMGVLVIRLQEHRMCSRSTEADEGLRHITVLEEAHHILRGSASSSSPEMGGGLAAKSVEMLANAIAEMRTYGEAFVIVDQAPGLLDASVIRNTNTKIIMRLPDQTDRELVGRAANLNDEQILELARLQRGVAAVYQNEWIEPVLCHVDRYEKKGGPAASTTTSEPAPVLTEDELRYINSCVYDPNYLARPSDISFVDCVERLEQPDSLKSLMVAYARTRAEDRKDLYQEIAFRYFGVERLARSQIEEGDSWDDALSGLLDRDFVFQEDTSLAMGGKAWQRFSRMMLAESILWVERNELNPERIETMNNLWRLRLSLT